MLIKGLGGLQCVRDEVNLITPQEGKVSPLFLQPVVVIQGTFHSCKEQ